MSHDQVTTEELFREDAYLREVEAEVVAVVGNGLVLNRTVFYPQGGGQPGDIGSLHTDDGQQFEIVDTGYVDGRLVHQLAGDSSTPELGTKATLAVDWTRRHRLMRMHSCLHLLCKAVDERVTGGQIAADKSRLDFAVAGEVPTKAAVGERLNAWIEADHNIHHYWVEAQELDRNPELVRTMSVQPPRAQGRVRLVAIDGVDLQACGGTHVGRTREIGPVEVTKIESKGKLNRRFTVRLRD